MRESRAVLALVALFAIAVIVVDPRGNFPLNDDWGVGFTTFTLLETGQVQFTPFASATAYLQFAWGALWASIFGPSFTTLRFATLTLSLASSVLTYLLLRRSGVTAALSLFGAACLLFHPLFFWASFTSMTHVPYVFLSLLSAYAFVRAWEHEDVWLVLALLACVASFFTRQFAILNALAPLVVALVARRWRVAAVYAAAVAVFVALVVTGVLVGSEKELSLHRPSPAGLLIRAIHYVFFNWQNAALFFLPALLLLFLSRERARLARWPMVVASLLFGYAATRLVWQGRFAIPYMNSGNVFTDFGLGPPTLRDVFTFRMAHPFALRFESKVLLMIVTTVAAVITIGFVARAVRHLHPLARYCAFYLLAATLITAGMRINFDRYSVDTAWPLGIMLVLLASGAQLTRAARLAAALALSLFIILSVSGTAEYLSWNRARWEGYGWLRQNGVPLERMDGGYEINSMLALRAGRKDLGKPGVGVVDDLYILTFNRAVPGYQPLRGYRYERRLGLSEGHVWVQVRNAR